MKVIVFTIFHFITFVWVCGPTQIFFLKKQQQQKQQQQELWSDHFTKLSFSKKEKKNHKIGFWILYTIYTSILFWDPKTKTTRFITEIN